MAASEVLLEYGRDQQFAWAIPDTAAFVIHQGPTRRLDPRAATRAALDEPLDFPPLAKALVPGDRIILAVDRELPALSQVIAGVWDCLSQAGIAPEDLLILQPATWDRRERIDPRRDLPEGVRERVVWKIHDPTIQDGCGYLASSASGERVYLSREVLDADFVLPITRAGFDPLLGYRSPAAALYPGLSTTSAIAKAHGQGHSELRPQDDRPLRQLIDEIGWLLGVQIAIQVLPSRERGGVSEVLAGTTDGIGRRARQALDRDWRFRLPTRTSTAVIAVPAGEHSTGWDELGAALELARSVVTRGGRVIVLTDLEAALGPGMELLRDHSSPRGALQPLREMAPPDWLAASRFAIAADWARIYLLSRLDPNLAEDLFVVPLGSTAELERLLATVDEGAIVPVGPFSYGEIGTTNESDSSEEAAVQDASELDDDSEYDDAGDQPSL